jgi:hypothetical protein
MLGRNAAQLAEELAGRPGMREAIEERPEHDQAGGRLSGSPEQNRPREAAVPNEPLTRGYGVGPGEGVPDQGPEVKASGRSTGGSLTLIELDIDGGPPRRTHTREDESFYRS